MGKIEFHNAVTTARLRGLRSGLAVICLACFTARCLHADSAPPVSKTRDQLIRKLLAAYKHLSSLPGIEVKYRYEQQVFQPKSVIPLGWSWAKLINVVKPNMPGKVRIRAETPETLTNSGLKIVCTQEISCDNDILCDMTVGESASHTTACLSRLDDTKPAMAVQLPYFYYLGLPVLKDPNDTLSPNRRYPAAYWPAEAMSEHAHEYRLLPQLQMVDGEWCHVLERPGWDKMWVADRTVPIVRRRQFRWSKGGPLRLDIRYSAFEEFQATTWLPKVLEVTTYPVPGERNGQSGRPAAMLKITASMISVSDLPDSAFRSVIPQGAKVQDYRANGVGHKPDSYVNSPGFDPFEPGLSMVRRRVRWGLLLLIGSLALAVLVMFGRRLRQRA